MTLKESKNEQKELFISQGKDALNKLLSKEWYTQIPNILTASRGISPLVILPFIIAGNIPGAVIAECVFASTDFMDGKIARKYNLYSEFGRKLDTICDKVFAVNLLLPILFLFPASGLNIGFEVLIGAINTISMIKGNNPKSTIIGKCKTAVLSLSIITAYLSVFTHIPTSLLAVLFGTSTLLQGGASINYYILDKTKDINKDGETIKEPINGKVNDVKEIESKNDTKQNEIIYNNSFNKEEKPKVKTLHL